MIPLEEYPIQPDITQKTSPETDAQGAVKKLYGPQQKFGFMNETDPLCMQITTHAGSMIDRLNAMPPIGTSPQDIYIHAVQSQSQTNKNMELLKLSTTEYKQKTTLSLVNNQFDAKLKSASISSTPLNFSTAPTPKTPLERFDANPLWLYQEERRNQNEAMGQAGKAIGTFVKEAVCGMVEETMANIERYKQKAFDPTDPRSLFHLKEKK